MNQLLVQIWQSYKLKSYCISIGHKLVYPSKWIPETKRKGQSHKKVIDLQTDRLLLECTGIINGTLLRKLI